MLTPQDLAAFVSVIRAQEGREAVWVETVAIHERGPSGRTIWAGEVHTFTLEGQPDAPCVFAWRGLTGTQDTTIYVVPQRPPVDSASTAVRRAMLSALEHKRAGLAQRLRRRDAN